MAKKLRTIERQIASIFIYDRENYLLMGRKTDSGAVYANSWQVPGGGREDDETILETAVRETFEETGLVITPDQLEPIAVGAPTGKADKTLATGERVHCRMYFNRFAVHLGQSRNDITLVTDNDLAGWRWFAPDEIIYDAAAVLYAAPRKYDKIVAP